MERRCTCVCRVTSFRVPRVLVPPQPIPKHVPLALLEELVLFAQLETLNRVHNVLDLV